MCEGIMEPGSTLCVCVCVCVCVCEGVMGPGCNMVMP